MMTKFRGRLIGVMECIDDIDHFDSIVFGHLFVGLCFNDDRLV